MNSLTDSWRGFCEETHAVAVSKGWWSKNRSFLEAIGMVVSELGELTEAFRSPDKPSCKILAFSHAAEELADIVIRLADLCEAFELDLGSSLEFQNRTELFHLCDIVNQGFGNHEDQFVCCFDVLLENPVESDIERRFRQANNVTSLNPVERIAIVEAFLGLAILDYVADHHLLDTESHLASALMEVCHIASDHEIDLGEAILAKHAYNKSRPYRHGNKAY